MMHNSPENLELLKQALSRCDVRFSKYQSIPDFVRDRLVGTWGSGQALWHKVGEGSAESRWSVFNTYGPWFMKPYHRFDEMFASGVLAEMFPVFRQLLHRDSRPPNDQNESMITLARVRAAMESQ